MRKTQLLLGIIVSLMAISGPLGAEERITRKLLEQEQRLITVNISEARQQLDIAREDINAGLVNTAWQRVVKAGEYLDRSLVHGQGHNERIARWKPFFDKHRDELFVSYKKLVREHADVNRLCLAMEKDVGSLFGVDFGYLRAAYRILLTLCERTGDPKWCERAERMKAAMSSGDFTAAYENAGYVSAAIESGEVSPGEGVNDTDISDIEEGPDVRPEGGAGKPGRAPDGEIPTAVQAWLPVIERLCAESNDPVICEYLARLRGAVTTGDYTNVEQWLAWLDRYIRSKPEFAPYVPQIPGIPGGGAIPVPPSVPRQPKPGDPEAAAAYKVLADLMAQYQQHPDPRILELYNQMLAAYRRGDYAEVMRLIDEANRLLAEVGGEAIVPAPPGSGGDPGDGEGGASWKQTPPPGGMVMTPDGDPVAFVRGVNQPGYKVSYVGGEGKHLVREEKFEARFVDGAWIAESVASIDWQLDVETAESWEGDKELMRIGLVDGVGNLGFTVNRWTVRGAGGAELTQSTEEVLELDLEQEWPSKVRVTAEGETDWESPFQIEVEISL